MLAIKVEVVVDVTDPEADQSAYYFQKVPAVGFVFQGSDEDVGPSSLAEDIGTSLTALYPENDPPA